GFSLLELMVGIMALGVLAAIAVPAYNSQVQKAKVAAATSDILKISAAINHYASINGVLPASLAAVAMDTMLDPWGRPYAYLSFPGWHGNGKMRRAGTLVPITTKHALSRVGADGISVPPLTARPSQDDVVMAKDGNYVGLASNY